MIETDTEDVGVGELVDALVELAEDRVEVERGRDLAADVAQQLDVLLAVALGPGQRLGRFGTEPRLGELRPLTLLADHPAALDAGGADRHESGQQQASGVGPPRAIPGRQDREGVGALVAHLAGEVTGAHAELEIAEAEIGVVAAGFIRPRRPVAVEAIEPRLVLHRPFARKLGCGEFES